MPKFWVGQNGSLKSKFRLRT